jgi:AcrR family transcriptional regulator
MGIRERKDREKNLRRQQIQESAKELFLLKGFNSTTMEDIAKRAELSPATIYLYFRNKDELYASLNLITTLYLKNRLKRVCFDNKLSVDEKVFKLKDALYSAYKYDPLIFRNILHIQLEDTLLDIKDDLVIQINKEIREILRMLGHVYEEGVQQGKFVEGHSTQHADIMYGIFIGLVIWEEAKKKLNPKKNFAKPTLDKAFEIFSKGIRYTANASTRL